VVADDGTVYCGTEDGAIFAVERSGEHIRRVGKTDGRPLGLEWLPDGRLLICDAHEGLLTLDLATGEIETLLSEIDGVPMVFCNNAAVDDDGTIYFSDSSTKHSIQRWRVDMVEDTGTGRLFRLAPGREPELLMDGLRFANGVALAQDRSFVCVAETTGRTVVRLWLSGPKAGQRDLLVDDLPGYPDNIARGSDGLIWVAIPSTKVALLERLLQGPAVLRRVAARIPQRLQPEAVRVVRVMAFDDTGALVHDWTHDASDYHMVVGVREHRGRVWVGSLVEPAVAWFDLD